jgi:hypothetical protein
VRLNPEQEIVLVLEMQIMMIMFYENIVSSSLPLLHPVICTFCEQCTLKRLINSKFLNSCILG